MRLGLIARADSRGLGIQTKSFYDHMRPTKTMVVDCPSLQPLPLHLDRFPDATVIHGLPSAHDVRTWLQGLDVVYTAETGYGRALWDEAQRWGVKTVLHANYEFLDRRDQPTLWAAPSAWHFNDFPSGALLLPVPVDLDKFTPNTAVEASRFLHIVGRPAIHDRNGTRDLLHALQHVTTQVTVTVRCQDPRYVQNLIDQHHIRTPSNVTLVIHSGDVANYWDNYTGQDVLIMPRRFGGLSLPVNEALGAGLPVIMPDISPNNTWLPCEWLVPAAITAAFKAKQYVDVHETNPQALAAKIDLMATDNSFYSKAADDARHLGQSLSWDTLKPIYEHTLSELCSVSA